MEKVVKKTQFGKKLGAVVRRMREAKGISLKQFEVMDSSFDKSMMSRIEKGQTVPNSYTIYRICEIIGITMSELMKELESEIE